MASDSIGPARLVSCNLTFEVEDPTVQALQVAVAAAPEELVAEELVVTLDGRPLPEPVVLVPTAHRGRTHLVRAAHGTLEVRYAATVRPSVPDLGPAPAADATEPVLDDEGIVALRQSRYCPSDRLEGFAAAELRHLEPGADRAAAVASWVFERLAYAPGSSGPDDDALDTLAANAGVCRDFAHLTVTLCRALGIPARLASVYAPGLSPMDFHAVAEVRVGADWEVLDATRLAPRSSLVRIATGRDAADTAFATSVVGRAELTVAEVSAVVEGDLPLDDHTGRVALS